MSDGSVADLNSDILFGVVGLGEVGLPLGLAATRAGFPVVGVDIDQERTTALQEGRSYIQDVSDVDVEVAMEEGFTPTAEYNLLSEATHVAICVPTPLQKSGQPDVSYVLKACEQLTAVISPDTTVIIESTVYPSATKELFATVFEEAGFTVGEDVYLAFSPERIDPGNEEYDLVEIPKVIGGVTEECGNRAEAFYADLFETIVRTGGSTEAEMVKILENTFRNVNIALVNELVKVADNFDIDFWNVIEAAKTKPYGFMPFYPGPGLGGHCIPVDPMYLSWRAKQDGIDTPLVDLADRTNREMSVYIVDRVTRILNENGVPLPGANVLVLGVAYKPDVPDTRKSPARDIIRELDDRSAVIEYNDPHVPSIDVSDAGQYESVELTDEALSRQDCVIIVTDHADYDFEFVVEHAPLVFDTRNATAGLDDDSVSRL
ncbi:nucleotide sugar dehydrogenase [Halorientalis pallida]|uniref:nucleotide sugar dehydrogenase n=1 Tax=Halorientalis pallida TaxID=2479928 RepID=UPI003C6EADD1